MIPFYDSYELGRTGAFSSFWVGGDTSGISISDGLNLNKTMFAVPPGTDVAFEVGVAVSYENNEGDIEADFRSGDFKIACPVVVFSLLNAPTEVVMS